MNTQQLNYNKRSFQTLFNCTLNPLSIFSVSVHHFHHHEHPAH